MRFLVNFESPQSNVGPLYLCLCYIVLATQPCRRYYRLSLPMLEVAASLLPRETLFLCQVLLFRLNLFKLKTTLNQTFNYVRFKQHKVTQHIN